MLGWAGNDSTAATERATPRSDLRTTIFFLAPSGRSWPSALSFRGPTSLHDAIDTSSRLLAGKGDGLEG
jgi:hypothetical protein